MSVSVQQAANNALAAWLTAHLTGSPVVDARWADPTRILNGGSASQRPISISVLLAGKYEDEYIDNIAGNAMVTTGMRLRRQPIQLDVWAAYDVDRDDLVAQLDTLLAGKAGPTADATTAAELGVIDHGITLTLADGYSPTVAGFVFGVPAIVDTADSVGRSIYRATYAGFTNTVVAI